MADVKTRTIRMGPLINVQVELDKLAEEHRACIAKLKAEHKSEIERLKTEHKNETGQLKKAQLKHTLVETHQASQISILQRELEKAQVTSAKLTKELKELEDAVAESEPGALEQFKSLRTELESLRAQQSSHNDQVRKLLAQIALLTVKFKWIPAKYDSHCLLCGGSVRKRERVLWEKEEGVIHVACSRKMGFEPAEESSEKPTNIWEGLETEIFEREPLDLKHTPFQDVPMSAKQEFLMRLMERTKKNEP